MQNVAALPQIATQGTMQWRMETFSLRGGGGGGGGGGDAFEGLTMNVEFCQDISGLSPGYATATTCKTLILT